MKLELVVIFGLIAAGCSQPAPALDQAGPACVDRLVIPRYSPIASSARVAIQGLEVSVRLAAGSAVESVALGAPSGSESALKLLEGSVEASMRASTFRPDCGGKAVSLVFDFRLSGSRDEDGRVVFHPPNRFEVFDTRPLVEPEQTRSGPTRP